MIKNTNSEVFTVLSQASKTAANADVADVNTLALSYPTAAVHSAWPAASQFEVPKNAGWNGFCLRFLLKDTAGDAVSDMDAQFKLWDFQGGYSAARLILHLLVTAGTAVLGTAAAPGAAPVSGAQGTWAGQWGYCDTITLITNLCEAWRYPTVGDNGICELYFDGQGKYRLFGDWDCDAGASACDDGLAIIRGY